MYLPALILIESDFATTTTLVQISILVWYAGLALPQLCVGDGLYNDYGAYARSTWR